jgi:hypothetical protein
MLVASSIGACGSEDVTVSERDVGLQAMGRWIVKDCHADGGGPTGSPWRCSVTGTPGIAGDYTVRIASDGAFRVENPNGAEMSQGCCLDVSP